MERLVGEHLPLLLAAAGEISADFARLADRSAGDRRVVMWHDPGQLSACRKEADRDRESTLRRPRGPLSGLLVADFSRVLAGPYATMLLADLGAEVVKVESPDGDETRTWTPPDARRRLHLLPGHQPRQALGRAGPARRRRPRAGPRAGPPGRRDDPELPARAAWPGSGSTTTTRQRRQPRDRLRLDQRVRHRRRAREVPGYDLMVQAVSGPDEPDRRPGRAALPGRHLGLRRDGRQPRGDRHPGRAAAPRRDRRGPARGGQPAVVGAVRPGQPQLGVRRRRRGALPDGQRAPERLPLRAAARPPTAT